MIPIIDLKEQYNQIKSELESAVLEVLASGSYILGKNVTSLEEEFAQYLDVKKAVGVASGTDAIHIALRALDVGQGDEVIVPSFTFFASAGAVALAGATPVFAEINPYTFNIDINELEKRITPKTKAIIAVHLYGQPADMSPILETASKYNLYVIEDCAQSMGAVYKGKKTGSIGDIGCFSFFPTKNLGACGDGGMITTNSDYLAERVTSLRNHGGKVRYYHEEVGTNSRLDEIQAAILRVKLPHIDKWNSQRRAVAYKYNELLKDVEEIQTPVEMKDTYCVYHQYTIKTEQRDNVHDILKQKEISSMIYYPVPIHLQNAFKHLGCAEGFLPVTEAVTKKVLSLPMYPELTLEQQIRVVKELKNCLVKVCV